MSSFNNNQILHIAAECAVIAAITFYVSIKYKQIQANLESLKNRIEEQSEIIQKHEAMIKQLSFALNKIINNPGDVRVKRGAKMGVERGVNIMGGEIPHQMKSEVRHDPQRHTNSPPKTELPTRKKPIIEEISVEEELKNELEELNLKTKKSDEKSDKKSDEKSDDNSDLKIKKEEEKSDEK